MEARDRRDCSGKEAKRPKFLGNLPSWWLKMGNWLFITMSTCDAVNLQIDLLSECAGGGET